MGVDAPDWQRQITVNPTVTTNLPININKQDLPVMTTGPVQVWDMYKRMVGTGGPEALTAGQTKSIASISAIGVGASFKARMDNPNIQIKIEYDGVLKTTLAPDDVWTDWGGEYFEDGKAIRVTKWDEVNDLYILVADYGWKYLFSTKIELFAYNPTAAGVNINYASIVAMTER